MAPMDPGQNLDQPEMPPSPQSSMQPAPQRQPSHVLTLDEIGNLASAGGKPAETLMNVVALIAKRFKTDVCSAYLLEPDRANLILTATLGLRPQCIGTLRMALHEGLAGLVAEQVQPVAVEQVKNHPRFKYFSEAGEEAYQSFLGVPLIDDGVLQGVLVVQTTEARIFDEDEIKTLSEAAAQLAPVVSEARTLDRFVAPIQERLWALARNLWWSWDHDSTSLFHDLDPLRWRQLNHNPIALLSEIPLAGIDACCAQNSSLHNRIMSPTAGKGNILKRIIRERASRGRATASAPSRISPRNSACTNPFPFIPAAWASSLEITSRARPISTFHWSGSGSFTARAISGSVWIRMAGSRKNTFRPTSASCPRMEPAISAKG